MFGVAGCFEVDKTNLLLQHSRRAGSKPWADTRHSSRSLAICIYSHPTTAYYQTLRTLRSRLEGGATDGSEKNPTDEGMVSGASRRSVIPDAYLDW